MTRKLVLNHSSGFVNGEWDDDDFDDGETEVMLGVPAMNFADELDRKRKQGARFDRQIDGPKPKTTRRRHYRGDEDEDDADETARPLSMNVDAHGEQLLGCPIPDWDAISRGTSSIVHNDADEDMLGTPTFDWVAISKRDRR